MKHKSRYFLARAKNSLLLSIEAFNRPFDIGRKEASIIMLDHAFEMLLKAVVLERTGRIRHPKAMKNYALDKCVDICCSEKIIDERAARVMRIVDDLRDAAVHDIVIVSEGMLYHYIQEGVLTFGGLMEYVFGTKLREVLPARALPITTDPPTNISVIIDEDFVLIKRLLASHMRKTEEVKAMLRVYQVIENNMGSRSEDTPDDETIDKMVKKIKLEADWRVLFPSTASIQASEMGTPMAIYVSKNPNGAAPVKLDNAGEADALVTIKPFNTDMRYPFFTTEMASKLGIGRNQFIRLVKLFQLRGNVSYHITVATSRKGNNSKYSSETYKVLKMAINTVGLATLLAEVKAGKTRNPGEFR